MGATSKAKVLSRKDFLAKAALGALGTAALVKLSPQPVLADTSDNVSTEKSVYKYASPPKDVQRLWLNTGSSANSYGVNNVPVPAGALCTHVSGAWNTGWKPVTATWY